MGRGSATVTAVKGSLRSKSLLPSGVETSENLQLIDRTTQVIREELFKLFENTEERCEIAATVLSYLLHKQGISTLVRSGSYDDRSDHVWVETDQLIIDPTRDQFHDHYNPLSGQFHDRDNPLPGQFHDRDNPLPCIIAKNSKGAEVYYIPVSLTPETDPPKHPRSQKDLKTYFADKYGGPFSSEAESNNFLRHCLNAFGRGI